MNHLLSYQYGNGFHFRSVYYSRLGPQLRQWNRGLVPRSAASWTLFLAIGQLWLPSPAPPPRHSAICQEPFFLEEASKQWTPRLYFMNNVHLAMASGYWRLSLLRPLISMIWVWRGLLSLAFSFPDRLWPQCSASYFCFCLGAPSLAQLQRH